MDLLYILKPIAHTYIDDVAKLGTIEKIVKANENDSFVIFLGSESINWITGDCGKSYDLFSAGS